jgi:hypothetical protein
MFVFKICGKDDSSFFVRLGLFLPVDNRLLLVSLNEPRIAIGVQWKSCLRSGDDSGGLAG